MRKTTKDYVIRNYENGDENQIVELLKQVFGQWPSFHTKTSPLDHWNWKFKDNPFNLNNAVVCTHNGELVGCNHDFFRSVLLYQEKYMCGGGVDLAVHPDHRRKGIWKRLLEKMTENRSKTVDFILASSSNPIIIKKMKEINNIFFPCNLHHFVYVKDIDLHYKHNPESLSPIKKSIFTLLQKKTIIDSMDLYNVKETNKFDESFNSLLSHIKIKHNFIINYDTKYLNWRYSDIRSGDHIIKYISDSNNVIGFIVVQLDKKREEYVEMIIQEIVTLDNRSDIIQSLLFEVLNIAEKNNINYIRTICIENSILSECLSKTMYVKTPHKISAYFNPYTYRKELNKIKKCKHNEIYLMPGYFDVA